MFIVSLPVMLTSNFTDEGYLTPYTNLWTPGMTVYNDELLTWVDEDGIAQTYICKTGCKNNNSPNYTNGKQDKDSGKLVFDDDCFRKLTENSTVWELGEDGYELKAQTDSKLKSLRTTKTYQNIYDEYEKPAFNEDWLYYYRKGVIRNVSVQRDYDANIIGIDGNVIFDPPLDDYPDITYATNLMAYGSAITDITISTKDKTISFTYYIDAHLKARLSYVDEETGKIVYSKFELDLDSEYGKYQGEKYVETYDFDPEDEEWQTLLSGSESDNDISSKFNEYISSVDSFDYKKLRFSTEKLTKYKEYPIYNQKAQISYVETNLTTEIQNKRDILCANVFKEDLLSEIHFKPIVESDVKIDRGLNAAFERHLRLGEVKSLSDMEDFRNGAFFNIQNQS